MPEQMLRQPSSFPGTDSFHDIEWMSIRGGSRIYIRRLCQETCEEGVADEGILVSLMSPLGHGVGKERDIHFVAVFVRSLVGESHDTVQEGISAFIITDQKTFERSPAAVPLHKDPRAFGQSREVVGA